MNPLRALAVIALVAASAIHLRAADAAPVPAPASAPRIAKLDLSELQDDLRDRLLAKAENSALKQDLDVIEKAEADRTKLLQQAREQGKDLSEALKGAPPIDTKARQRLERLMKAEVLRFLVKRYGTRFAVVLDTNQFAEESIIYLDGEVVDITQAVKQALQLNEF